MKPTTIAKNLSREVDGLSFALPVTHVYNPLDYAWGAHKSYLDRYCKKEASVLLLGMNPGPWGMVQTGVPFGEVALVRDWMGISTGVRRPSSEHPKRLIEGFDCHRSEVSGRRLWGWAQKRFRSPDAFFEKFFVWNFCPLAFMEEGGRNRTPDKLPADERDPLFEICDRALNRIVQFLDPEWVLGVGKFAEGRAKASLPVGRQIGTILHPSPASPIANRGWAKQAEKQLKRLEIL